MATLEDRRHIERLIKTHKRVIQELELRQAREGVGTPSHVVLELEERRLNLAELESHLSGPKILPETREAVGRLYGDNVEFLIAQVGSLQNRQIKTEEQVTTIAQKTHSAEGWRLAHTGAIEQIPTVVQMLQHEISGRLLGQWLNRAFIFVIAVLVSAGGNFTGPALVQASIEVLGMAVGIVLIVRGGIWLFSRRYGDEGRSDEVL
jgi:hypothetical protein